MLAIRIAGIRLPRPTSTVTASTSHFERPDPTLELGSLFPMFQQREFFKTHQELVKASRRIPQVWQTRAGRLMFGACW